MKIGAIVLAVILFIIGILYLAGVLQLGTSGPPGKHHLSHFVLCVILGGLCLVWARFQTATAAR